MRALCLICCVVSALAFAEDPPAPTGKLTKKPKVVKYVEPVYPEALVESGATATVTLQLDLDDKGKVTAAVPTSPANPPFDAEAVKAALQLEFSPAEIDDVPAPVRIGFRYQFTVKVKKAEPTSFTLSGVVRERGTAQPIAGAEVSLAAKGLTAVTDADGRFAFPDLPKGSHVLRVAATGYLYASIEQGVPSATPQVLYDLDKRPEKTDVNEEIVIRVPKQRRVAGAAAVATEEARNIPGVMGDALAVVQNLPGVARASAGSGEVVVWGSAPAETRIYVDDVPIPYLYHRGGLRSVMNDSLVQSVELVPGGFGAAYGRATGGLVRIVSTPIPKENVSGAVNADFIDSSAAVSYRQPGQEGHSAAVGGRVGYLNHLLPAVAPNVTTTVPLAGYWDYAGKYMYRTPKETWAVMTFGARDEVDRVLGTSVLGQDRAEQSTSSFHRLALLYDAAGANGFTTRVRTWAGVDNSALEANFGGSTTVQKSAAYRAGFRSAWRMPLHQRVGLTIGVDSEAARVQSQREGTLSLPAREGDMAIFGQPPGEQVAFDRWVTHQLSFATYAELEWSPVSAVTVTPGVRFEPSVTEGNRSFPRGAGGVDIGYSYFSLPVMPRLAAELRASEQLSFNAAAGLYQQPADPADQSAVFGGTALEAPTGAQVVFGGAFTPRPGSSLEAAVFAKTVQGLAMRPSDGTIQQGRALVSTGEGRSYGGQLTFRPGTWNGLTGWASYSLMRSERRENPSKDFRLFDLDQTHVLVAVASWEPAPGWRVGTRVRASTGYPRTPVTGSVYEAASNLYEPIRGENNGTRLPTFVQMDLRAEREGKWSRGTYSIYLDVLNVTNRENPEEIVYSFDYSQQKYLTGLPLLVVLGGRLEF